MQWKTLKYVRLTIPIALVLLAQSYFTLPKKWMLATYAILGVLLALIIEQAFKGDQLFYPILHWEHRGLIVITTFLLGLTALVFYKLKLTNGHTSWLNYSILFTSIVFIVFQLRVTSFWSSFTEDLNNQMVGSQGLIDYEQTAIAPDGVRNQFTTQWTLPSLALSLRVINSTKVSSMIAVPDHIWQPWTPGDRKTWPRLESYGVQYRLFGRTIQTYNMLL